MYSRVLSAALCGIEYEKVWVETVIENGLFSFSVVGLANQSIKESKDRIRSAISNCGIKFPDTRITINLTPAGRKKNGNHFDLAMALAVLISSGILSMPQDLNDTAFLGELTLDGKLYPVDGVLPMIIGLRNDGVKNIVLPEANISEASLIKDVNFYPAKHLKDVIDHVSGFDMIRGFKASGDPICESVDEDVDFADIKGQEIAKRAALVAAAGFHGLLMIGSPGVGKSMIGRRIPGIMPVLSYEEKLESTKIYSVAGLLSEAQPLISKRPFRDPHHNISMTAMIGGGIYPRPGEVSLAHNGILFLDELPEYDPAVLDSLRTPLEDGCVSIARLGGKYTFPSHFMPVAAMNPCRCGYYGDSTKPCRCTESDRKKYMNRVSGPLLDRIDMHIVLKRPDISELTGNNLSSTKYNSRSMREAVSRAVQIQRERYRNLEISRNSELTPALIKKYCRLDKESSELMSAAYNRWQLSARGYQKVLKLSRTIADLAGYDNISAEHVSEALSYRLPEEIGR